MKVKYYEPFLLRLSLARRFLLESESNNVQIEVEDRCLPDLNAFTVSNRRHLSNRGQEAELSKHSFIVYGAACLVNPQLNKGSDRSMGSET